MRIAGTCFARLKHEEGKYFLLLNKGRFERRGERILSPIGGGLEAPPRTRRLLARRFGATDFEGENDLRFRVPDNRTRDVAAWFQSRRGREATVLRELTEELTQETSVLTGADLRGVTERFAGFYRYSGVTTRKVPDRNTTYLMEIYDVTLSPTAMRKLVAASRAPLAERWVHIVTVEEVANRQTRGGVTIGPISDFVV